MEWERGKNLGYVLRTVILGEDNEWNFKLLHIMRFICAMTYCSTGETPIFFILGRASCFLDQLVGGQLEPHQ